MGACAPAMQWTPARLLSSTDRAVTGGCITVGGGPQRVPGNGAQTFTASSTLHPPSLSTPLPLHASPPAPLWRCCTWRRCPTCPSHCPRPPRLRQYGKAGDAAATALSGPHAQPSRVPVSGGPGRGAPCGLPPGRPWRPAVRSSPRAPASPRRPYPLCHSAIPPPTPPRLSEAWKTAEHHGSGGLQLLAYGFDFNGLRKTFIELDVERAEATVQVGGSREGTGSGAAEQQACRMLLSPEVTVRGLRARTHRFPCPPPLPHPHTVCNRPVLLSPCFPVRLTRPACA